jgi:hypothetical protein
MKQRTLQLALALALLLTACGPGQGPGTVTAMVEPPLPTSVHTPTRIASPSPSHSPNLTGPALATSIMPADPVSGMLAQVDSRRALVDLRILTGEAQVCDENGCVTIPDRLTGGAGLQAAEQYIVSRLIKAGYSPQSDPWSLAGHADRNILVRIPGTSLPEEEVYVIAHMDGVQAEPGMRFPAADDNASGVVALLELARVMQGKSFDRTILLFFSSGEEQGELGVQSYLGQLDPAQVSAIQAVINVDMIGYDANGDGAMELWRGTQTASLALAEQMSKTIEDYRLDLSPEVIIGCY